MLVGCCGCDVACDSVATHVTASPVPCPGLRFLLYVQVSQLWKDVVIRIAKDYPDVELSHMYIDNA